MPWYLIQLIISFYKACNSSKLTHFHWHVSLHTNVAKEGYPRILCATGARRSWGRIKIIQWRYPCPFVHLFIHMYGKLTLIIFYAKRVFRVIRLCLNLSISGSRVPIAPPPFPHGRWGWGVPTGREQLYGTPIPSHRWGPGLARTYFETRDPAKTTHCAHEYNMQPLLFVDGSTTAAILVFRSVTC